MSYIILYEIDNGEVCADSYPGPYGEIYTTNFESREKAIDMAVDVCAGYGRFAIVNIEDLKWHDAKKFKQSPPTKKEDK